MQFSNGKGRSAVIWGAGALFTLLFIAFISSNYNKPTSIEDTYKNITEKKELLAQMRIHLLQSVEMEKNAVMALTDEESQEFAGQSLIASATVDQSLKTLRSRIDTGPLQEEKKLVEEFSTCWTEFRKLDQIILELAVQNTNLHAASLSREKGDAAMQRFERAIEVMIQLYAGTPNEGRVTRLLCHAMTAGLKMYNLHSPHIAEASDEKMDRIEAQMQAEENEVAKSLEALTGIIDEEHRDSALQAKTAFADFMAVTSEVIKLSRQNSNIKSLELSLGKKRKLTAQCDEILATFQETVQSRTFKATR